MYDFDYLAAGTCTCGDRQPLERIVAALAELVVLCTTELPGFDAEFLRQLDLAITRRDVVL